MLVTSRILLISLVLLFLLSQYKNLSQGFKSLPSLQVISDEICSDPLNVWLRVGGSTVKEMGINYFHKKWTQMSQLKLA